MVDTFLYFVEKVNENKTSHSKKYALALSKFFTGYSIRKSFKLSGNEEKYDATKFYKVEAWKFYRIFMERSTKKRMRQMVRIVEEAVAHVPLVTSSTQGPSTIPTVPTVSSGDIPYFMQVRLQFMQRMDRRMELLTECVKLLLLKERTRGSFI